MVGDKRYILVGSPGALLFLPYLLDPFFLNFPDPDISYRQSFFQHNG
jgi:hypothetical protein